MADLLVHVQFQSKNPQSGDDPKQLSRFKIVPDTTTFAQAYTWIANVENTENLWYVTMTMYPVE